jgi:hypothetical protein
LKQDYMDSYEHLHSHLNGFFIVIFIQDISQGLNIDIYTYIFKWTQKLKIEILINK